MATNTYECASGHGVESPVELAKCPAMVHGKPCPGALAKVRGGLRGRG